LFYGWVIVATLFVVNFAVHATGALNLGLFIVPMGDELGISRGLFGWLTTSRSLAGGIAGVLIGRVLDRFGPRILLPLSSLVTGLCVIGLAFAGNVVHLFLIFTVMGLSGLSNQGGGLLTSVPVAKWFVRKRGTAMAAASVGLGIGGATFVPFTQLLIDHVGWRDAWLYLGILSMVLIMPITSIFLRRQPEDMGLRPDGDSLPPQASTGTEHIREPEVIWSTGEALRTRAFWLLMTSLALGGFAAGGSVHRIPYWVGEGFDPGLVSLSISAHAACASMMILVTGPLVDRFPSRFIAASAFAGYAGAVTLMLMASSTTDMFTSAVLWGTSAGINIVTQPYMWADYFGRTFLGSIRGITMPTILLASAFGAPAVGYVFDFTGGYESAWIGLIGIYIVAFAIMISAVPPRK
jgi:sugar phosphate permease